MPAIVQASLEPFSVPPDDPSSAPVPPPHRRLRKLGAVLLTAAIALGGVVLLLLFFQGRDHSQIRDGSGEAVSGPGQVLPDQGHEHLARGERPPKPYASDPPASGAHVPVAIRSDADGTVLSDDQILHALESGDVVLLYGTPRAPAALRAVAERVAGPFEPALATVGQAVVVGRRPGIDGVVALAWRRLLRAPSAGDPALEEFASFWLGRGAAD